MSRSILRVTPKKLLVFFACIVAFGLIYYGGKKIDTAFAYNTGSSPQDNEVHQWITEKAVNYAIQNQNGVLLTGGIF